MISSEIMERDPLTEVYTSAGLGFGERAAMLLGATDAMRESTGALRTAIAQTEYEQLVLEVRGQMDEATYSSARRAGGRMGPAEAVGYALHAQGVEG